MELDEQLLGWINLGTVPLRDGIPMKPKDETERPGAARHGAGTRSAHQRRGAGRAAGWPGPGHAATPAGTSVRRNVAGPSTRREHIPGARFVDLDLDLADHHVDWPRSPSAARSGGLRGTYGRAGCWTGDHGRRLRRRLGRARRPGCGGCSTPWAIAPCGCSTVASRRGARRGDWRAGEAGPDMPPPPASLSLATDLAADHRTG